MMVWYGLLSNEFLGPYFFDETVTGSAYRQMLVDYAWSQLQGKRLYFQRDGVAPHYVVIVHEWYFLVVGLVDVWLFRLISTFIYFNIMQFFSLGISKGYCIQGTLYLI